MPRIQRPDLVLAVPAAELKVRPYVLPSLRSSDARPTGFLSDSGKHHHNIFGRAEGDESGSRAGFRTSVRVYNQEPGSQPCELTFASRQNLSQSRNSTSGGMATSLVGPKGLTKSRVDCYSPCLSAGRAGCFLGGSC